MNSFVWMSFNTWWQFGGCSVTMGEHWKPRILIVGAGSVGVILGYHLSLAEAEVTFLIRPHRARALDRPQILHCYDDNKLKVFKGYSYNTDPAEMTDTAFDYIVITLDGTSLQNEDGQSLVETIGKAARGTGTKIIIGSVAFNLKPWFPKSSGS